MKVIKNEEREKKEGKTPLSQISYEEVKMTKT